jgi:hypothetical protein
MKNINWKTVLVLSVSAMIIGFVVSMWGMGIDNDNLIVIGLLTVMAVCVSWWCWVMYVIRTMIRYNDRTAESIDEIRNYLHDLKLLFRSDK